MVNNRNRSDSLPTPRGVGVVSVFLNIKLSGPADADSLLKRQPHNAY